MDAAPEAVLRRQKLQRMVCVAGGAGRRQTRPRRRRDRFGREKRLRTSSRLRTRRLLKTLTLFSSERRIYHHAGKWWLREVGRVFIKSVRGAKVWECETQGRSAWAGASLRLGATLTSVCGIEFAGMEREGAREKVKARSRGSVG